MSSEDESDLTPSVSYSFDSFTMVYCNYSKAVGYVYGETSMCDDDGK